MRAIRLRYTSPEPRLTYHELIFGIEITAMLRISCFRLPSHFRPGVALIIAAILSTGLATITTNCADPDLWGHVQYGREVLRDGVLPRTATWTYAAEGAPWVNHENIAEFLLAGTVDAFGTAGLPWMKLSLAALIFALMMYSARKSGAGWLSIAILVTVVAANVQFHWHFRPQILTYTCLAMMLALWQHVFRGFGSVPDRDLRLARRSVGGALRAEYNLPEALNTTRESQPAERLDNSKMQSPCEARVLGLWLLPPLMCFWANSHGGFAAGLAILGVGHAVTGLQLLWRNGLTHREIPLKLTLITIASFAATLLNPYGIGLWQFMLDALKLPRPEIADWGPLELWSRESTNFWLLIAIVALSLGLDRRRVIPAQTVLLALLLWQGVSHCRHLSILAIACGFWIPRHLHAVIEIVRNQLQRLDVRSTWQENVHRSEGFGRRVLGTVALIGVVAFNVVRLNSKMADVPVERSEYPVAAMQFLHDRNLRGKVLVTFNWAQYAIGCFAADGGSGPPSRVAVDGRFETCYPREITDVCFDFWLGPPDPARRYRSPLTPPFDPARALKMQQPDLVLLSREQLPSVRVMQSRVEEWVLLYQDALAQLWGRRSKYDDAGSPDFMASSVRHVRNEMQIGSVSWPALPLNGTAFFGPSDPDGN